MHEPQKIKCKLNPDLYLKVIPGHFSSDRFHINYYVDMTSLKTHQSEALAVAKAMVSKYSSRVETDCSINVPNMDCQIFESLSKMSANTSPIDTIICMDGCEVIGAYVAEELSKLGVATTTYHKSAYIISPEFDKSGQMVVRDNIRPMIKDRHVLVVLASAMSGRTIEKSLRCIRQYGGIVEGISVIFGVVDQIGGYHVNSVFSAADLEAFSLEEADKCTMCAQDVPLDAIVNSYGYSML